MNWFITVVKKYAVFSGRSRRSEYWYYMLVYLVIYAALAMVDVVMGTFSYTSGVGLLSGIFALALLLPSIGVGIRRLHDTGRSGWWLLLGLIPVVGIVLLLFLAQDSEAGTNRFGPNPKEAI